MNSEQTIAGPMPAVFLAHGSPFLLDDELWTRELKSWADAMPRPTAILMISAHWEERPITLGATTPAPLVYDFYGFPEKYYRVQYPAPGAPEVAKRIRELLGKDQVREDPARGLDHGAYIPLKAMYPQAEIPVLQMSIPTQDPKALLELGRKLAPLREEGVLIIGSGFLIHNLRLFAFRAVAPPAWAHEFDHWAEEVFTHRDVDALLDYRSKAPAVNIALPTHEHFIPSIVTMGASSERDQVIFPVTGFVGGPHTKRSVQFG
jgi:4,5-DOPA dioxygenase extradiol